MNSKMDRRRFIKTLGLGAAALTIPRSYYLASER